MDIKEVNHWVSKLGLEPHPEGGYFKSTFASDQNVNERKLYTSIYFLLTSEEVSHFHRLKSDELWYFHAGSPLTIHVIHENGDYEEMKLGLDFDAGEVLQALVPKNAIFGSSVMEKEACSLVGCMVSPGFDYQDFELFTQAELLEKYPQHREIIKKLAYENLPKLI